MSQTCLEKVLSCVSKFRRNSLHLYNLYLYSCRLHAIAFMTKICMGIHSAAMDELIISVYLFEVINQEPIFNSTQT